MTVAIVDEPTTLVLYGNPAEADGSAVLSTSWAFLLLEQPDGSKRLLSRTRYFHDDKFRSKLMGGPLLIEPVSFVTERRRRHTQPEVLRTGDDLPIVTLGIGPSGETGVRRLTETPPHWDGVSVQSQSTLLGLVQLGDRIPRDP